MSTISQTFGARSTRIVRRPVGEMSKMNGRTRRVLYGLLAKRDGDFCKMCTVSASERQLIIDHKDNDNANNRLDNLQLLCRACNYRKNPRRPVDKCVRSEPVSVRINHSKEPEFRKFVYKEMVWRKPYTFKKLVYAGAEKVGISPITAERYLNKMCSDTGALRIQYGCVEFKEQDELIKILTMDEIEIIDAFISRWNEQVRMTSNQ